MNNHTIEQANESLANMKRTIEAAIAEHTRKFPYPLEVRVRNNEICFADGGAANNYKVEVSMELKGTRNG